ncbi:MAG: hypothetical protein ACE5GE_03650 [Phycisphaerae bacterium]
MMAESRGTGRRWLTLAATFAGCCYASLFPSCKTALTTFNPCGSVFGFCNPSDIDRLFADVPDFDLDPTCTIPFFGLDNPNTTGTGGGGGGQVQGTCTGAPIFPFTPGPRP